MRRPTFESFEKKALARPGVRIALEENQAMFELTQRMIRLRQKRRLTQEDMADRLGTKKSNISRLESATNTHSPRLGTLEKYARELGYTLKIDLMPMKKQPKTVAARRNASIKRGPKRTPTKRARP